MKLSKKKLDFDLVIQTLIIGIACLLLVSAIFAPASLFYYLFCQIAIGFWQVLSAFIIVMITGNKKRIQYLVAVIAYFINVGLFTYFMGEIDFDSKFTWVMLLIVLPSVYAIWYFKMTYIDVKNERQIIANSNDENESSRDIWNTKEFV